MDSLVKLITLILAISLAGERLVAFIKTLFPWLAGDPNSTEAANTNKEISRKTIVMAIAFLSCWLTAYLVKENTDGTSDALKMPAIFLGLLASGGSAFWTTLLGYTKAVRDIKVQQTQQEQVVTGNVLANAETIRLDNRLSVASSRLRKLTPPSFNSKNLLTSNRI